jgi:hypothetical protein
VTLPVRECKPIRGTTLSVGFKMQFRSVKLFYLIRHDLEDGDLLVFRKSGKQVHELERYIEVTLVIQMGNSSFQKFDEIMSEVVENWEIHKASISRPNRTCCCLGWLPLQRGDKLSHRLLRIYAAPAPCCRCSKLLHNVPRTMEKLRVCPCFDPGPDSAGEQDVPGGRYYKW